MVAEARPEKASRHHVTHRGQQEPAASAGAVTRAELVAKVVGKVRLLLDSDGHPVFVRPVYAAAWTVSLALPNFPKQPQQRPLLTEET